MFRLSGKDDFLVDVEKLVEIEPVIRSAPPGRYHVDEISSRPLPSGYTAQKWGTAIKRADDSVVIEPGPW
jgi:hypothetical protein